MLVERLESDVVGTLKALNGLFPKELNVDVQHTLSASSMTDEQLLDIVKSRAINAEKPVTGQVIENNQAEYEDMVTL